MWTMWAAPPAVEPPEEERGSELVQTALILALVVIVAIGVLQALGVNIVGKFQDVVSALGG
jgi:Flp pilus assembly pilin Flp